MMKTLTQKTHGQAGKEEIQVTLRVTLLVMKLIHPQVTEDQVEKLDDFIRRLPPRPHLLVNQLQLS